MLILFIVAFLLIGTWFIILAEYNESDDYEGFFLPSRNQRRRMSRDKTRDIEYPTWGRKDKD